MTTQIEDSSGTERITHQTVPEFLRSMEGQTWQPEHTERIESHIWELEKTWLFRMVMALGQPLPEAK